ncbi:MAG: putative ABC transporter permease [Halanaerobiales bacterium]
MYMLIRYIIYGLIGWCLEVFWTGFGSLTRGNFRLPARTYLWMFFIYGLAVLLEPVHNKLRSHPVLLRGGIYVLIIFSLEYVTGWFLKSTVTVCPWDYSGTDYSVNGFIRLDYAPLWFLCGLLFEQIHDYLLFIQNKI